MDEDERNKKLKAGKEKLAAFQKKKSKKRHHGERTGNHKNTEPVESSSVELSSSSEVPFLDDSDQVLTSEDEMNTRDTKTIFKIETKLKHATERIAELEESLEGKQLALNRVIEENAKLKVVAVQDKIVEMESALSKRDEIIRQLTTRLQSTIALESEAEVLTQQVQQLQSQLINAGKLMESQNSKQMMSSQALLEAKNEIVTLQSCLQDKDSLLNQLSDKVTAISSEYVSLKSSYDTFKQHSDNGGFGRPGIANVSGPDQTHDLEVKVQEIRLQLEENYRNQISLMKEELVKQYGTERDSLNSEIYRLQEKCSELEIEREKFLQDKHVPDSSQENSDPRTKLQDLKAKLIEIQNEKDKLMQENVALNNQLTSVEEKLTMTIDNMSKNALDNGVGVQDESDLVNELKEKNSALLLEVESYKKDLDETRKQMIHLQQKSRGSAKFQVDSQEIVMELKQVTEQYEEALVNIALMKGKIEDYDIKCEDLTEDLEKLKKKLETSDELVREYEEKMKDYELMKGNVENTKEQMKSFDEKIVNYESKIKELVEDVKIWKNKCEEVEKQRRDFDSKVVNLEKEVEIARKQNEEYCDKFVDYEQQLTDYEGLMTQFNELQHECNVYQTQNDDLNNKINIQQDVVVELKAEIEIFANQNQMFQEQTLLQTQCVEKLTIENKSLQEVVELHKSQVDQLTQALNQSTSEVNLYQEKACSLESAVKSLEIELQTKYSHEKLKEKDEIIQKLSEEVGELTAQMKVLYSENGQFQKETVGREETTPLNESFNEASSLSNFQEHLENKIEQSVATTLTLEFLSQSGQQEVTDSQSNDALQNQMLSQPEREMDADSLDGGESTHTLDSLEPTRENDLSSQISEKNATIQSLMQEVSRLKAESISITEQKQTVENLTAQITDLEDRNNKLENWNADLLDQINELSVKAEKHNAELSVNMESSDEDTLVQTFRLQIDSLHEEKSKLQESNLLLEKSVTNQNETLKSTEAMLATLEREKLALHNELTIVNDVIEEFSQREELSQNREKGSVELSYDSTCISSSMCNKLKLFQSKLTSNMDDYELLKSECETMLSDKQEIQDKLDTLLLENESLCSQIKEIEKENQTLKSAAENQEQVKKLSDCNHAAPSQLEDVNEELHQAHIEIEQLKNSFEAASEKEQILQSQVLRLSEQISHLSAINQAVSGDKENLENRFVEATHSEATGSNQANENQVRTSHDFVSPSQNDAQTSNQSRDLLGNIDVMKCSKLHDLSLTNHDEESQAGVERSDDGTDVSVGQSSSGVQQVEDISCTNQADDAEDISEDQTMVDRPVGMSDISNEMPKVNVDNQNSGSALHEVSLLLQLSGNTVKGENEQLLDKVLKLEEENNQLHGKILEMSNSTEVRVTLENKIVELVSENQNIKEHFDKNQELLREEHDMLRTTMKSLKESSVANQLLKDQIQTMYNELKVLSVQKQELEKTFETIENAYLNSQSANEELRHQCDILEKKSVELERWQILAEDLESRYREKDEQLNLEIEKWEKKLEIVVNKNKEIVDSIEMEKENLSAELQGKISENITLQKRFSEMMEKCEKSEENETLNRKEIEDLNEKLTQTENRKQKHVELLESNMNELKEKCEDYENQLIQIKELYQELEHESNEFENQNKELLESSAQQESAFNELQTQCSTYKSRNEILEEKLHKIETENEHLSRKLSDIQKEKEILQFENKSLEEKFTSVEGKFRELESMEIRYKNEIKHLEDRIETLDIENVSLKSESSLRANKIESQGKEISERQEELSEMADNTVTLKESIQELQNEKMELKEKCKQLEVNNKAFNDKYSQLVEESHENQEKLLQTVNTLSSENMNLSQKIDELENETREQKIVDEKVNVALETELDEKTKQLIEKDLRLSQILSEVERNNSRYELLHSSHSKLKELSSEYKKLQQLYEECNRRMNSLELENKDWSEKHEKVHSHSENLQKSLQEYMEELEQTQRSLVKLQEDHFELKNKKEALESENDSMKQHREILSKEISSLSEELAVVEQERKKFFEEQKLRERKTAEVDNVEIESESRSDNGNMNLESESRNCSVEVNENGNTTGQDVQKYEQSSSCENENYIKTDNESSSSKEEIVSNDGVEQNIEEKVDDGPCRDDQDEEFVSEEELEALIQQRIDCEKKQIEYDLEEKYEVKFRQRQVELMHEFSQRQKELEKNFEHQVNHRLESLRSEKDKAFVKTLQKVKKDFEKRHKKEMERQHLAHIQEVAKMEDEMRGGGHIKDVVQNLVQENEDLAEARDALLQEVEYSHHQQEQLEDELRNVISQDDGDFLQKPVMLSTQQSRFSHRSESVILDWEFSPSSSFEHDKDPPDFNGQIEFTCKNPQCRLLLMRFQELQNSINSSGFHPEVGVADEFVVYNQGFKNDFVKSENLSTPTTELEASFVKEALKKAAESFSKEKQCTSSRSINTFIEYKEPNDSVIQHKQMTERSTDGDLEEDFIPVRFRSHSLNLPQDANLFEEIDREFECKEKVVRREEKPTYMKHSRHRSLDEVMVKNSNAEGKFVAEIVHDQTQRKKSLSLSTDLPVENNSSVGGNELRPKSISHRGTSLFDLSHTRMNSNEAEHNPQGEFFEECISGDLDTLAPSALTDIAIIKSTTANLEREVTPDSHIENEVFKSELSDAEKQDKEKLLKRLESLKDIYCKEKQDLLSKCENLTIQLENESLSRRQLEQELININEDFSDSLEMKKAAGGNVNMKRESKRCKSENGNFSDLELVVEDLQIQVKEKEDCLQQQEQKLNEIRVLFKSELCKLEVENAKLKELNSLLQNSGRKSSKKSPVGNDEIEAGQNCPDLLTQGGSGVDLHTEIDLNSNSEECNKLKSEVTSIGERDKYIADLENKYTDLRISMEEQADMLATLSQRCEAYEAELENTGDPSDQVEIINALQGRCHELELELEHFKQSEAFASVIEEKCKHYEAELEKRGECEEELEIITGKYEKLDKLFKEQNAHHVQELNSCTAIIEKLREKCELFNTELEEKCQALEQGEANLEELHEKIVSREKMVLEVEDKHRHDLEKMEELKTKCSNLAASLKVQKYKNNRLQKEADEKFKQFDVEIQHKEKALDEIHETCAKFELAGYENEHVIQELTTQCQRYQSEIQDLKAQELKKMKKTLSCSVDEIEMTDYQEITLDEFAAKYLEEEMKKNELHVGEKVVQESIAPTFVKTVETAAEDNSNSSGKISELEALIKDKDSLIKKYKTEVEQLKSQLKKIDDFRQHHEHIELSMREKDSYIKQLEEHFLQQRAPVSFRSKSEKHGSIDKKLSDESRLVAERLASSTPTVDMDGDKLRQSELDDVDESFSDQSTISGEGFMEHAESQDSLLSDYEGQMSRSKSNDSLLSDRSENSTQTLQGHADGSVEMKHFAIVEEISKLRQDLRETKSVYTQENTLLREALDREKWKRETTLEGKSSDVKHFSEVENLKKEVNALKETNVTLHDENDKLLKQIQEQEVIVLELREQLNFDSDQNKDKTRELFNQQFKLLQKQRNELVDKLHQSEQKIESLTQKMREKSISEQSLSQEKAVLQSKLCEMGEIEKQLTEKKIELEKQKSRQKQLEEMIYHRDLIERELMKQKRLLEVELSEIECKLREKEELLEIQKNQLLEEIKQNYSSDRISDTSKLMSASLDSADFSFDSKNITPSSSKVSTPRTHVTTSSGSGTLLTPKLSKMAKSKQSDPWKKYRLKGNVNRLELMLSDVEKEHAEAINYLKEKLEEQDQSSNSASHSRAHSS